MERGGVLTAKNSVTLPLRSHFIKQKQGGAERGACSGPGLQVEPEQEVTLNQLSTQRTPCKSNTCKKKSRAQRFVTAPLEQVEGQRQDSTLRVVLRMWMWPGDG